MVDVSVGRSVGGWDCLSVRPSICPSSSSLRLPSVEPSVCRSGRTGFGRSPCASLLVSTRERAFSEALWPSPPQPAKPRCAAPPCARPTPMAPKAGAKAKAAPAPAPPDAGEAPASAEVEQERWRVRWGRGTYCSRVCLLAHSMHALEPHCSRPSSRRLYCSAPDSRHLFTDSMGFLGLKQRTALETGAVRRPAA